MGMLVNGTWFDDDPLPADGGGAFLRPGSSFRDAVSRDGSTRFAAEPGRYRLITAPSCPWAHRTVLMRALKRLDGAIPLLESDLPKGEGWAYSRGFDDLAAKDGVFHVHQVYTAAQADYTGRATVPVLWDCKTKTIVNNESSEIIRMLNSEFDAFGDASLDLYPPALRPEIDEINRFIYDNVNNGVYRAGLAKSQEAYEEAFRNLFAAFDNLETRLSRRRSLVGGRFTEADLRLFPTLIRFDTVYYLLFKCNLRRLADYHNLSNYMREIYRMQGVAATVDFEKIKLGYYGGMRHLNPKGILPLGPALDFAAPHDRSRRRPARARVLGGTP
jgi:glutathionyl-hydroquinone reductase